MTDAFQNLVRQTAQKRTSSPGQMEIKVETDAHPQPTYLRIREHHFSEFGSRLGSLLLCALFKDQFKVDLYLNGWKMEKNG